MAAHHPCVFIALSKDAVDRLSMELFELGASGVELRDETTMERPAESEAQLIGYFADEEKAKAAAKGLADEGARYVAIAAEDWHARWKAFFGVTRVSKTFVVRPPWEDYAAEPGEVVVTIDPGQAFGTGTHETTRLVMRLMDDETQGDVLDVGCGSGILAVTAMLAGAKSAFAIDIDPLAEVATGDNAELNGVSVRAATGEIADVEGQYELVFANIRTPVLLAIADDLVKHLLPKARLLLSGILVSEREEIRAAYDARLSFEEELVDGDWVALAYRYPA